MIEIMVGVLLLALILLPSLKVIIGKTRTVTSTRDHAQAALVAQNLVEMCRSYSFEHIKPYNLKSTDPLVEKTFEWKLLNSSDLNETIINDIVYKVDLSKTSIDPIESKVISSDAPPSSYLFRVTLNYTSKDGKNHSFTLSTVISQRE